MFGVFLFFFPPHCLVVAVFGIITLRRVNFPWGIKAQTVGFVSVLFLLSSQWEQKDPFSKALPKPSEVAVVLNLFLFCTWRLSFRFLYNRMGYWSDWSIPILVTTAAGFTYITVLLVSRVTSHFLEVLKRPWTSQPTCDSSNFPFKSDYSLPLSLSFKLPKINGKWKMHGLWSQVIKSKDRDPNTDGVVGQRRNTVLVPP